MGKLVIKGRIIDGTGKEPFPRGVVIIDGSRIQQIGTNQEIVIPEDAEIIDAKDDTILPGLIDVHVHLSGKSGNQFISFFEPETLKAIRAAASCKTLLDAGFTSVRDVAGLGVYLKRAIAEGIIRGPRISSANRMLTQTAGHGDVHNMPIEYVKNHHSARICDGADDCRKAAREQFREGADFIKISSTGGVMSEKDMPGASQFTIEEIMAIVEEARRVGSYVAAHAQGIEGIKNALKAGVKTIEHGTCLDKEAAEMMLESGAIMVPTLAIGDRVLAKGEESGIPEHVLKKARAGVKIRNQALQRAKEAGVKIALGTDFSDTSITPFNEIAQGLELLVKYGFLPMEVIMAATKIGAEVLQMEKELGTLETGKLADLIIVNSDPIADITCLKNPENIKLVVKNGVIEKNIYCTSTS